MLPSVADVLLTFPARMPNKEERELLKVWSDATRGETAVYIAERRSDDPRIRDHIMVFTRKAEQVTHVLHAPSTVPCWLVSWSNEQSNVEIYGTLREALHSILDVRAVPETAAKIR
jgi:hypothetical protein